MAEKEAHLVFVQLRHAEIDDPAARVMDDAARQVDATFVEVAREASLH